MITDTPYRPALSSADAITELKRLSGSYFAQSAVEQFVQALGMFPSGSIVELNTGEVAIVAEQDPTRRLRPRLLIVRDAGKEPLASPRMVNLGALSADAGSEKALWIVAGHPIGTFGIDPHSYFL